MRPPAPLKPLARAWDHTLHDSPSQARATATSQQTRREQPTQGAEWGYDVNRAVSDASSGIWWTGLFPGLAIVLLVTGLTLLGEGLNETLNPVLRRRRFGRIDFQPLPEEMVPETTGPAETP